MKGHVEDLSDKTYSSDDWEDVVHKYTGFLCAAAKHTMRLNSSLVKTATKNVFKPDPKVVNDFGDAAMPSGCRSRTLYEIFNGLISCLKRFFFGPAVKEKPGTKLIFDIFGEAC